MPAPRTRRKKYDPFAACPEFFGPFCAFLRPEFLAATSTKITNEKSSRAAQVRFFFAPFCPADVFFPGAPPRCFAPVFRTDGLRETYEDDFETPYSQAGAKVRPRSPSVCVARAAWNASRHSWFSLRPLALRRETPFLTWVAGSPRWVVRGESSGICGSKLVVAVVRHRDHRRGGLFSLGGEP